MVVPKKKTSKSRTAQRSANKFLVPKGFSICKETGEVVPPHRVSPMGWYKGKKVLKTKAELKNS